MALFFHPVDGFSTANPYIKMNWSKFSLPEAAAYPELIKFKVKIFNAFTRDVTGLGMAYKPVNDFLETLSIEDQKKLALVFLIMHIDINDSQYDLSTIEALEDKLGDMLNNIDDSIDLCTKINSYIRMSSIPISDMKEAGTRPQDTPSMTFNQEEAITITTIAILVKLFSPIIGVFIDRFMKQLDNQWKEGHAHAIFLPLFKKRYSDLICKLTNYIKTLTASNLDSTPTAWFNGNTLEKTTKQTLDMIVVKRFVNVDLYRPDGNIIKYIAACCRSGSNSQQQNAAVSNSVRILTDPVELDKDEGNASRMESESKQSSKTADSPIIIKVAAKIACSKTIKEQNLDSEIFNSALAYYRKNIITVNPISIYLLCTYFGQELGGGNGIFMLKVEQIAELSTVLQMLTAGNGAPFIAHALTLSIGASDRNPQFEDSAFLNAWKSSQTYIECKKLLPSGFGERDWDIKLKEIANFLVRKSLTYNTAPVIWELSGEQPCNGKAFTQFKELMFEIMMFIQLLYKSRKLDVQHDD